MQTKSIDKIRFIRSVAVFSVVLILGVAFMVIAVMINQQKVPDNYIKTEAKIVNIEEELRPGYEPGEDSEADKYNHYVFVDYTYEGKTYANCEYANYNSSMKVGDTVIVYVNPADPAEFICDLSGNFIFIIVAAVVLVIGAGGLGYTIIKKKRGMD